MKCISPIYLVEGRKHFSQFSELAVTLRRCHLSVPNKSARFSERFRICTEAITEVSQENLPIALQFCIHSIALQILLREEMAEDPYYASKTELSISLE